MTAVRMVVPAEKVRPGDTIVGFHSSGASALVRAVKRRPGGVIAVRVRRHLYGQTHHIVHPYALGEAVTVDRD